MPSQEVYMDVLKALQEAKKESRKRKFVQSWDLSVNLKNIDLKRPENRLNMDFQLPEGRGSELKVCVIADSLENEAGKAGADFVIKKQEITGIGADKKRLKEIANTYDLFLGEMALMADVGRHLGTVLGPRGKMARPIPLKANLEVLVRTAKKTSRIVLKENPVIHLTVGKEDMEDEKVARNVESVVNLLQEKMPKGKENIKSVYIKLTMGKAVKVM
jgi:large subunit ribosomal protein L1